MKDELVAIQDISLFRKFLALCATRAGQILNMSNMANECGISTPTVKAWLSALEKLIETWFWRDSHGNEVDLLLEKPQQNEIVEIKATSTITPDLFKGLNFFSNLMPNDNLEKYPKYT